MGHKNAIRFTWLKTEKYSFFYFYLAVKASDHWGFRCFKGRLVFDVGCWSWSEDDHQPLALFDAVLHQLQPICNNTQPVFTSFLSRHRRIDLLNVGWSWLLLNISKVKDEDTDPPLVCRPSHGWRADNQIYLRGRMVNC